MYLHANLGTQAYMSMQNPMYISWNKIAPHFLQYSLTCLLGYFSLQWFYDPLMFGFQSFPFTHRDLTPRLHLFGWVDTVFSSSLHTLQWKHMPFLLGASCCKQSPTPKASGIQTGLHPAYRTTHILELNEKYNRDWLVPKYSYWYVILQKATELILAHSYLIRLR